MTPDLLDGIDVRTERDDAIPLHSGGYSGPVLRVKCRRPGARRWSRFLLIPDPSETLDDLEPRALVAAELYLKRQEERR